tara:strand:+ start:1675 stop:2259 length:585 start_codon:yes stop_codon:yes gene_type:complete
MVLIREYTKKDGTEGKSIRLSGIGEEETVLVTLKSDAIWKSPERITGEKDGRVYDFRPCGIGVKYCKNDVEYDVWLSLTEVQCNSLERLMQDKQLGEGSEVLAYKPEGKRYVAFKTPLASSNNTPSSSSCVVQETISYPNDATDFEKEVIKQCKEENLSVEDTHSNFEKFKQEGKDIKDSTIERVKSLYLVERL